MCTHKNHMIREMVNGKYSVHFFEMKQSQKMYSFVSHAKMNEKGGFHA